MPIKVCIMYIGSFWAVMQYQSPSYCQLATAKSGKELVKVCNENNYHVTNAECLIPSIRKQLIH